MKKIYYLSTCSTCKRINKDFAIDEQYEMIDIKKENIPLDDLEKAIASKDNVKDLFNTRARKIKTLKIDIDALSDNEIKELILKEYTFLKRPVLFIDEEIFVGNSKSELERLKLHIDKSKV